MHFIASLVVFAFLRKKKNPLTCSSLQPFVKHFYSLDRFFLFFNTSDSPSPLSQPSLSSSILRPQRTDRCMDGYTHRCTRETKTCGRRMKRLTEEESGEETEKTGEKMEIMTVNEGRVESCGTKWGTRRKNTRRWWNCVCPPLTNNTHHGLSVNTPQLQRSNTLRQNSNCIPCREKHPVTNKRQNNNCGSSVCIRKIMKYPIAMATVAEKMGKHQKIIPVKDRKMRECVWGSKSLQIKEHHYAHR